MVSKYDTEYVKVKPEELSHVEKKLLKIADKIENNLNEQNESEEEEDHIHVEKIKLNLSTVVQIIAFIIAAVTQYNVVSNEIDDNKHQLHLLSTSLDTANMRIKELEGNINRLESENALSNELINGIQIRLSVDKRK